MEQSQQFSQFATNLPSAAKPEHNSSVYEDKRVQAWQVDSGKLLHEWKFDDLVKDLSHAQRLLAVATDKTITLIDVVSGKRMLELPVSSFSENKESKYLRVALGSPTDLFIAVHESSSTKLIQLTLSDQHEIISRRTLATDEATVSMSIAARGSQLVVWSTRLRQMRVFDGDAKRGLELDASVCFDLIPRPTLLIGSHWTPNEKPKLFVFDLRHKDSKPRVIELELEQPRKWVFPEMNWRFVVMYSFHGTRFEVFDAASHLCARSLCLLPRSVEM